jgi:hypothetical protein
MFRGATRATVLLGLLAALALVVPTAAAAASKPPSNSKQVSKLVSAVNKAKTDKARRAAVRSVIKALGLGVVDSKGRVVVSAPKGRLVIYEPQIKTIADELAAGSLVGPDFLVALLNGAGVTKNGKAITAEQVVAVLAKATKSATKKKGAGKSFGALLLRELGRKRSFSPSDPGKGPQPQFDPLQVLVFNADLIDTVVSRTRKVQSSAITGARTKQSGCQKGSDLKGDMPLLGELTEAIGEIIPEAAKKVINNGLASFQYTALAYAVDVKAVAETAGSTHYGHESDGKPLTFGVTVRMVDDYGEFITQCLKHIGIEVPPQGPIPDVRIMWDVDELEKHGEVDCTDSLTGCFSTTNSDGLASLTFKPKRERYPEAGPVKVEHGATTGTALYQSKFGNVPGSLAQFLVPKFAAQGFTVSYHQARKYRVSITGQQRRTMHEQSFDPTCNWTNDQVVQHDFATRNTGEEVIVSDTGEGWRISPASVPDQDFVHLFVGYEGYSLFEYNEDEGGENCGSADSRSECGPMDMATYGRSIVIRAVGRRIEVSGWFNSCHNYKEDVLTTLGNLPHEHVDDPARMDPYVIKVDELESSREDDHGCACTRDRAHRMKYELRFTPLP